MYTRQSSDVRSWFEMVYCATSRYVSMDFLCENIFFSVVLEKKNIAFAHLRQKYILKPIQQTTVMKKIWLLMAGGLL